MLTNLLPPRRRIDPAYRRFERHLRRLLRQAGIRPSSRPGSWVALDRNEGVSWRIRRVQEYVAANVGEVRTLDEMAEVAGLSRFHFARRFRDEVGESPWAFVRRLRAEEAVRLLQDGHAPAEAAHEAGFADQAHLTRTLRTHYGRTPGQIRQESAEAGQPGRKNVQDSPPESA